MGKAEVGPEFVKAHHEQLAQRALLQEKNKKLRALKKPEEYVPPLEELVFDEQQKSTRH